METGHTGAASSRRLPACRQSNGGLARHSAQDVARPETPTISVCFGKARIPLTEDTLKSLVTLYLGLLSQTLSSDVVALSMYSAKDLAKHFGVDEEAFAMTANEVHDVWKELKKRHPMASMF